MLLKWDFFYLNDTNIIQNLKNYPLLIFPLWTAKNVVCNQGSNFRIAKYVLFFHSMMLKKSHLTIFIIQNFVSNTKNTCEFHLDYWDHVCNVNERCLVNCFHHEFRVSTQIVVPDFCITKCKVFCLLPAFNSSSGLFFL